MSSADKNPSNPHTVSRDLTNDPALLSWIQQLAPYGIVTLDTALNIQFWNHWMELNSSLPAQEVVGKNLLALFPDLQGRKMAAHFQRALEGESIVLSTGLHHYLLPMALPARDDDTAPTMMLQTARIAPLRTGGKVCGIIVIIEDVTQRERQAEILRRQHVRDELLSWALAHFLKNQEPRKTVRQVFFKIAEHLDFDTFILHLHDVDTGALELYAVGGVTPELEKDLAKGLLLSNAAKFSDFQVFNHVRERTEPEYAIWQKLGLSSAIAIPLLANDRSLGLLCFGSWSRDSIAPAESELLTTIAQYLAIAVDRENTNQQLRKARVELSNHAQLLEQKVKERTAELQETVAELETFSYTLAHDLKAPVRGIIGYCDVLKEDFGDVLPLEARNILERLARTPRRMETLIKDLLQFTEISRQEIALSRIELDSLIDEILAMRLPEVRSSTKVSTPLLPVRANRTLLQQALANLVDNAIKFVQPNAPPRISIFTESVIHTSHSTRPGKLLFSSKQTSPAQAVASPTDRVRIWVCDEGVGISADLHQKIFGIFERGEFAERYEGTGMGLAIVARATQRMGGTCGVESESGAGSRFWIELPAA